MANSYLLPASYKLAAWVISVARLQNRRHHSNRHRQIVHPALSLLITFGFLAVSPALSDIIDVSVGSPHVGGNGNLTVIHCGSINPCSAPQLSFSADIFGDTALGTFGTSGSTSVFGASLTSGAQQITGATADSFSIDLLDTQSAFSQSIGTWSAQTSSFLDLKFTLTTPSVMHLVVNDFNDASINAVTHLGDSEGHTIFEHPNGSDVLLTLDAGTYGLFELATVFAASTFLGPDNRSQEVTVNAQFTPIPEPRWTVLLLGLCVVGIGIASKRKIKAERDDGSDSGPHRQLKNPTHKRAVLLDHFAFWATFAVSSSQHHLGV